MSEEKPEGFCPSCGEPCFAGKIHHDEMCPFAGDEREPEDACGAK